MGRRVLCRAQIEHPITLRLEGAPLRYASKTARVLRRMLCLCRGGPLGVLVQENVGEIETIEHTAGVGLLWSRVRRLRWRFNGRCFLPSFWNPIGPERFDRWKGHDSVCKHRRWHPYVEVDTYVSMSEEFDDPVEDHLAKNIHSYGPIPVAVDSGSTQFELYHDGILRHNHCGKNVDHAVLVVGYTRDYWILKNSWGSSWGQGRYMLLERGTNACGINSYAAFATSVSI